MKALIRKELREHFKVAVVGLVVLLLLILVKYRDFTWSLKHQYFNQEIQPLMGNGFVDLIHFFCAIFGGVLGWLQVWNERHRDLWAFLVHRPLTRTQIFFGKSVAGLFLYLLMPGLPLLGCILWVAVPGHVPAPFEWQMVLPITAAFLAGIVYYFAGMLTGLRQARWFASRGLGLVMAILVSAAVSNSYQFWQALFCLVGSVAILSTAAWGAFHSEGHFKGQPVPGKVALSAALGTGLAIIVFIAALLLVEFVFRARSGEAWSSYVMTTDGAIYKETMRSGGAVRVVEPVQAAKADRPLDLPEIWRKKSNTTRIDMPWRYGSDRWRGFQSSYRFFAFWHATPGTVWYYWYRYGCLVGYDLAARRLMGSLGPNGFSPGPPAAAEGCTYQVASSSHRTIETTNAVYEVVDLDRPATKLIFSTSDERILAGVDLVLNGADWVYTVLITEHSVLLLSPDGKVVWKQPFKPVPAYGNEVKVSYLEPPGQFAVWVPENTRPNSSAGGTPPTLVTWFGREQGALKSVELAALPSSHEESNLRHKVLSVSLPPVFPLVAPLIDGQPWPSGIPKDMLRLSLLAALVCIPAVWWLGRRYRFSFGAKASWSGFVLFTGIPGLLAFLSAQEWPARESCPKCGKLRVVEREQCEHCGADFAPADKTGTEIFEPVGKAPG